MERNILFATGLIFVLILVSVTTVVLVLDPFGQDLPILGQAPDFTLTNQSNETVSLSQFEGKVVMLGFMYTDCPDEDFCILLYNDFRKIQNNLWSLFGEKFVLLMVSLDPARDTPEQLFSFGSSIGADFSGWHFLTGDNSTVHAVLDDYGVAVLELNTTESSSAATVLKQRLKVDQSNSPDTNLLHNWVSVLIDQEGMIRYNYHKYDWSSELAIDHIKSLV